MYDRKMARPIEFNRAEALEAGMKVFWAHGYAGASLDRLIRAMGLSKSSFYQAFGSKRDFLLAAIDHYTDRQIDALNSMWQGRRFGEGVRALLAGVIEDNCGGWGCMLVNSAAEIPPHDPGIAGRIRDNFERTVGAFAEQVRRAQAAGELPADRDAHEVATYLVSSIAGLRIFAKAGMPTATLACIQEKVLDLIA